MLNTSKMWIENEFNAIAEIGFYLSIIPLKKERLFELRQKSVKC